jgi:putative ABC transport system substrate-binding protein
MRRREFIAGVGGVVAWPLAVRAQQRALPVVGYLGAGTAARSRELNVGLRSAPARTRLG